MTLELGYLSLGVRDRDAWTSFARDFLAVETVHPEGDTGDVWLRMDDRSCRYIIRPTGEDDVREVGWEVASRQELEILGRALTDAGVSFGRTTFDAQEALKPYDHIVFDDPDGLRTVVFVSPGMPHDPVSLPKGHSGFVTGDQGAGHAVLPARSLSATTGFYEKVMGFAITDYIYLDPSISEQPVVFMHCNARHHSLAFYEGSPKRRLSHIMLQCRNFDDIGVAMDAARDQGIPVVQGLGKHSNDHMVSFYVETPSGFEVEYGWGGRRVDNADWRVLSYDHVSVWGHHREKTWTPS